ncbi:MAG: glycosyltransferase family 87 protein [Verrucomicrobiia bacterium]
MNWLRRLGQNRLWDFGAAVIAVLGIVHIAMALPQRMRKEDFAHYYVARQLVFDTDNPYTVPVAPLYAQQGLDTEGVLLHITDPPTVLWLFAPLGLLPRHVAFDLCVCVEIVSLILVLWLTRRLLNGRLSARGWMFVCAATVTSGTVYWHFCYTQMQLSLAAVFLVALMSQRAGKHTTACLLVMAAGLLKLFPFVLLPWFLWRSSGGWVARGRRAALVVGLIAACVCLTGIGRWMEFIRDAMPVLRWYAERASDSFSLGSLAAKCGPDLRVIGPLLGPALVAFCYASCCWFRGDREAEFCLLSVAMLAGGLVVWPHYLVFLIFPMALAATRIGAKPTVGRLILFVLLGLAMNRFRLPGSPFLVRHVHLFFLVCAIPLYGLLGLAAFFWQEMRARREPASASAGE